MLIEIVEIADELIYAFLALLVEYKGKILQGIPGFLKNYIVKPIKRYRHQKDELLTIYNVIRNKLDST